MTGTRLPRGPARPAAALAAVLSVLAVGAFAAACGDSGQALARQACAHVHRSISLLDAAGRDPGTTRSTTLQQQALAQLRAALPIAAEAAYDDDQWQALMTTLSESNRVAPSTLVPALKDQCAQAEQSPFNQAPPPSS
ncbi:MAG TPA: hypothetical protein VKW77_03420, partial [Acidimicrobiales bacterium]|nr:hypothetical protein [Acidimicrobiales bacterium]